MKSNFNKLGYGKSKLSRVYASFAQKAMPTKRFVISALVLPAAFLLNSGLAYSQNTPSDAVSLYKTPSVHDSEFDNPNDGFIVNWRNADAEYEDTEFGELMYNEPSTPTKLEMLRLLSKDTPSTLIFMHAISMGLGIDEILQASVRYAPEKSRDLAGSAVSLLPLLNKSEIYHYSSYDLESLKGYVDDLSDQKKWEYKVTDGKDYSVHAVVDRFFNDRLVLRPQPDWYDGQVHFMATAEELSSLRSQSTDNSSRWYRSNSSKPQDEQRPIFISLYESDKSVLIDGNERVQAALKNNPYELLPVVFIYNRLNELPIDKLGYPATLKGLKQAYIEKNIMVTPTPEWQLGEYHIHVELSEFYELFNIPVEEDFEPEAWQKLIADAKKYDVNETSFIAVILGGAQANKKQKNRLDDQTAKLPSQYQVFSESMLAAWDDPRTESQFKFTRPGDADNLSLSSILGKGVIFNRPDLVAALNALGVKQIPVSIYYLDSARVKPFTRGPRSLIQAAIGIQVPVTVPPSGGVAPLPPASPPGLP